MALGFNEIDARNKALNNHRSEAKDFQLKQQQATGQKMSELAAHPLWEVYGRHVESVKAFNEASVKADEAKLLHEYLNAEDYAKLKISLAYKHGAIQSLTTALTIAKTLIEQGEKAAEELKL